MEVGEDRARKLCLGFLIGSLNFTRSILKAALLDLGKGQGYVKRQVEGWTDQFERSKTWNVPGFKKIMAWLKDNQPDDASTCLIRNDFRFDNVVLDPENPDSIKGVLDWEMATLGDPLMDLGGSLATGFKRGRFDYEDDEASAKPSERDAYKRRNCHLLL